MLIQKMAREQMKSQYNILCQSLYPTGGVDTPFGSTCCEVEPQGSTAPHHHHEGETFYILEGQGRMRIGADESPIRAGDVVLIPPFSSHVLTNTSATDALKFISVYWETATRLFEMPAPSRVLIFSAPPTPNGDLHLGHLSGPYVAADVYRRFLRANGIEATYVTGTDDHQSYVPAKAKAMGLSSTEVIDRFSASIQGTLDKVDARPDHFLSPVKTPEYIKFVQDFFQKLLDDGHVEWRETDTLYCVGCDLYLYEAHVGGTCPVCQAGTNANGCENCGQTNDGIDLGDPACNHCHQPASRRQVRKYYFALGRYIEPVRQHLQQAAMPPLMRKFAFDVLNSRVPDISITHLASWGIPVPAGVEGQGQVMYDWFEMAAGYLYLAQEASGGRGYGHFWTDPQAQVVEFFGFDNAFFYLILNPALLLAFSPSIRLPAAFFINQFYLLDGLKFSTSRRHAVWGNEILAQVPADLVRCYLGLSRSETAQTNFTLAEFEAMVRRELIGQWEPLIAAADTVLVAPLPRIPTEFNGACQTFRDAVRALTVEVTQAYSAESFSLNQAVQSLCDLVRRTRRFLAVQEPLRDVPERASEWADTQVLVAAAVRTLGILSSPIMPQFGAHVMARFGLKNTPSWHLAGQTASLHLVDHPLADGRLSEGHAGLLAFMS